MASPTVLSKVVINTDNTPALKSNILPKKIAFVGSSYISLEGENPKPGTRVSREFGKHDPKTYKLDNWTWYDDNNFATLIDGRNLIQELSKQNPHFKFYNVSSLGSGIDVMPERVTFTEENYSPDVYCIEIPNYLRLSWLVDDRYLTEYENFYPLQIYQDGQLLNDDKTYNRVPQIDNAWAILDDEELNQQFHQEVYDRALKEDQRSVIKFMNTYSLEARQKHVVSVLKLIHGYLTSKGKQVKFFQWDKPITTEHGDQYNGKGFYPTYSNSDVNFLRENIINETYLLKWANEKCPKNKNISDFLRPNDNSHLNFEGFKLCASYFDPIFDLARKL